VTLEDKRLEEEVREQWLYLTLAWIFEHMAEHSDPLRAVEEVYADFGYPASIANFVRYMPQDGPDLGSLKANEQRLVERWRNFIDERSAHYDSERTEADHGPPSPSRSANDD
jgi:hypothetical protein